MKEIIPAVLPEDFMDLQTSLARLRGIAPFVQIDICDGIYTESSTWPYGEADTFSKILEGDEGLPFWEDFQFELDLMVRNPEESVMDWVDAGASRIIIHNKSTQKLGEIIEKLSSCGVEIGIALQTDENVESIESFMDSISFIQCMGIAQIGVQGNPFDERVLENIREIKRLYPEKIISIDGGVTFSTATQLIEAGADRLVSGSAILKSEDPKESYRYFTELVGEQ